MSHQHTTKSLPLGAEHTEPDAQVLPTRKLSVCEAATLLGVSKSFLDKRRLDGTGPRYLKLGRRVVYDAGDLSAWLIGSRRRHTSEH